MDEIERIEKRMAQLKKKKQRLLQRDRAKKRKADTRAKIILGGSMLAMKKKDPLLFEKMRKLLTPLMSEKDQEAVHQWLSEQ